MAKNIYSVRLVLFKVVNIVRVFRVLLFVIKRLVLNDFATDIVAV